LSFWFYQRLQSYHHLFPLFSSEMIHTSSTLIWSFLRIKLFVKIIASFQIWIFELFYLSLYLGIQSLVLMIMITQMLQKTISEHGGAPKIWAIFAMHQCTNIVEILFNSMWK
jgi:hypothetical protein